MPPQVTRSNKSPSKQNQEIKPPCPSLLCGGLGLATLGEWMNNRPISRQLIRVLSFFVWVLLPMLFGVACEELPKIVLPFMNTPTPIPSPTPLGDTLEWKNLEYAVDLNPKEYVPGTGLQFIRRIEDSASEDIYEVQVDGIAGQRRAGDSLTWRGVIASGVIGNYQLNLQPTFGSNVFKTRGTVDVIVFNPAPQDQTVPLCSAPSICLKIAQYDQIVPEGSTIPGTNLIFNGQQQDGTLQFTGTTSYTIYRLNDSVIWNGSWRSNVKVRFDLRLLELTPAGIRVQGTGEMSITP